MENARRDKKYGVPTAHEKVDVGELADKVSFCLDLLNIRRTRKLTGMYARLGTQLPLCALSLEYEIDKFSRGSCM